jgi:hypothetical protein
MQDRPLEIRPLVPAARADSPERNDEQLVAVTFLSFIASLPSSSAAFLR